MNSKNKVVVLIAVSLVLVSVIVIIVNRREKGSYEEYYDSQIIKEVDLGDGVNIITYDADDTFDYLEEAISMFKSKGYTGTVSESYTSLESEPEEVPFNNGYDHYYSIYDNGIMHYIGDKDGNLIFIE